MWICINDAFLSIVKDTTKSNNLLVRARDANSIKNVFGDDVSVSKTPDADYLYRASIDELKVAEKISLKVLTIDYDNFKNSVKDNMLHRAYEEFWGVMYTYQHQREFDQRNKRYVKGYL